MADPANFKRPDTSLTGSDQFHRASSLFPFHHALIDGNCSLDTTGACYFKSVTITENRYESNNDFTKDKVFQVAATEMRVKFRSRQSMNIAAGELDASFHEDDEVGSRCAEINQVSFDWALNKTGARIQKRYQDNGQKMVMVEDRNTDNGGKWIIVPMTYTSNADKTEVAVSSYAYRMSAKFPIELFAGDHYCMILSPFKAMEWITTDSLYAKLAAKYHPYEEEEEIQFLQ